MTTLSNEALLRLEGVSKSFGATQALNNVRFDVHAGEVHALMGENGAGKSTLMKILAGNIQRDAGDIWIDGKRVEITSPADAMEHGIAIIHQELNTVPALSIAENLALGQEPRTRLGALDRGRMLREARDKLARIGLNIDPSKPLGDLTIGMQQMVEIARAVSQDARILVLDEPTAALTLPEAQRLYRLIAEMKARGVGLIYISHRMEEVWTLADRVTVFRDGKYVNTAAMADIEPSDVVRMMVGRDVDDLYHKHDHPVGDPVLEIEGLTDGGGIGPADLTVRSGEVVALAGLIGSGRTELARLIFGADRSQSGTIRVNGKAVRVRSPQDAIKAGIVMVPEDRKQQALFLEHTVEDNIAISSLRDYQSAGVLSFGKIRKAVLAQMDKLRLRRSALPLEVRALSGGNQQKAVLGRWLLHDAEVVILDEPTRGVDVGAKSEIYEVIAQLAAQGRAIIVVSSDLPEVLGVSDRILVMKDGQIAGQIATSQATEEQVMLLATGTKKNTHGASHV